MDDELDERTREALRGYRVPPAPPLDDMWDAIEERHFGAPVVALVDHTTSRDRSRVRWSVRSPSWAVVIVGVAASLIIGVGLGRMSRGVAPTIVDGEGQYTYWASNAEPYRQATSEYLGQTVALLTALPAAA